MTVKQQEKQETRKAAFAAAAILVVFGILFYSMPIIMLAVGEYSHVLAVLIGIICVSAFFVVFWLRARSQKRQ